jgi:stearoyl-CoA desaturase (delta-9 desaturase)
LDILTPATDWATSPSSSEYLPARLPLLRQIAVFIGVVGPFIGVIVGIVLLWNRGVSLIDIILLITMYALTVVGVTVGFHRLFTHRSFETVRPIRVLLAIAGSMSLQGPIIKWCAVHRRHHQLSDRDGDPHSPHAYGAGFLQMLRGMWHSHVGWLFESEASDMGRSVTDLMDDRSLVVIDRLFLLWVFIGVLIPAAAGFLLTRTWLGALTGFIWGGLVRLFFMHHVTWSINSVCHVWGTRPFASADCSTNNPACAIVSFGEGWHNNHHAFPTSARHGLRWWELDIAYLFIRLLAICRLAWDIRVPNAAALRAKMKRP